MVRTGAAGRYWRPKGRDRLQGVPLGHKRPDRGEGCDRREGRYAAPQGHDGLSGLDSFDINIKKASDQTVTNSTTLQNQRVEFQRLCRRGVVRPVPARIRGNNATGDYKCDFSFPSSSGWVSYVSDNTAADAINISTGIRLAAATNLTSIVLGTDAADTPRMMSLEMMLRPTANGTVQFRFANRCGGRPHFDNTRRLDSPRDEARLRQCQVLVTLPSGNDLRYPGPSTRSRNVADPDGS